MKILCVLDTENDIDNSQNPLGYYSREGFCVKNLLIIILQASVIKDIDD